jgi:N-methylhydantoinase B/oxoprolinase/acetone carboxylase alpha subunit
MEMSLPVRIRRYTLRTNSGGAGQYRGGDGLIREIEFLTRTSLTLLTERRRHAPYGLWGGQPGQRGANFLDSFDGQHLPLTGKVNLMAHQGDVLCIHTPGGGGLGKY